MTAEKHPGRSKTRNLVTYLATKTKQLTERQLERAVDRDVEQQSAASAEDVLRVYKELIIT